MKREIRITKTRNGVYVTDGSLDAIVGYGDRMDGTRGLTWSGTYYPEDDRIRAAVESTMRDGRDRIIIRGQDDPTIHEEITRSGLCPYCDTYCDGDCRAR